jgi:CHAT domain-containing protein/Tfp pilus assembly protein PilF
MNPNTTLLAGQSTSVRGVVRAVCLVRTLMFLVLTILTALPWWAYAQEEGASLAETGAREGVLEEWKRLNAQVVQLYGEGRYEEAIPLAQGMTLLVENALRDHHLLMAESLNNLAILYEVQGRYKEAESLYARTLAIREKALGTRHPDVAESLNNLANLYSAQGRHGEAEPLHLRALGILEKALGTHHQDVATSLNNLAVLYNKQGRYGEAEPLHLRALGIWEKTQGAHHPDVAVSLNSLAALYKTQGRHGEAEPLLKRALDIREKVLGTRHPHVAESLNNLAELYRTQARYDEAERLHVRALGIWEAALSAHHPHVAASLTNLAGLYLAQGRYGEAEPLYVRALGIWEKVLGTHHPHVATSLNNLAVLYQTQGRYGEAEPLLKRALVIVEKALGAHHPDVAVSLSNLAGLYGEQGRYGEAEPLYVRALGIAEKALGPHHLNMAVSLNNLAWLYRRQGRYREAEPLEARALGIWEKALGPHHPLVAEGLDDLVQLYLVWGWYGEAEPLLKRALDIREKLLGPHHPDVAESLDSFAQLYWVQARYGEAEPLQRRALGIREKALSADHPIVAANLSHLAALYWAQGRYGEAEPLLKRALGIVEKALGAQHPDAAVSLNNLAGLHLAQKEVAQALLYAEQAEEASDEHLSAMMRHGSEQQKHLFMAKNIVEIDFAVGLALRAPGDARAQSLAMRHLLRRKGRVLDAMSSTLAAIRGNLDDEGQALLEQYLSIRSQYARQYLRGAQNIAPEQHHKNLAELQRQKREIEIRLSEKSGQFAEVNRRVTLGDVQNSLPEDAVLVEWIRYQPFDAKVRVQEGRQQPARYAACMLARHLTPTCLDLNDAETIDAAALAFHRAVALGLEHRVAARTLDALIVAPLRRTLGSTRKLYLSPDGMLQFIPFAALIHQDADGSEHYLVEQFELVHVTGGRDLVRAPRTMRAPGPVTVLGNPRYSMPSTSSHYRFPRLPGTHQEAEEIGALFADVHVFTDADASEGAVKSARAPWILHLATHAYFGAQDCAGQPQATDNPLLAAGLALVGANACQDGSGGDGVLTGEEIAGLDLYGTQLVVLSACDTGIGALALRDEKRLIGVRDGVYGLRRALMLAGAETQVVSLWKVNDLATQELMAAYYRALLQGRGRAEAMRQVQRAMLRSKERAHPYYWASFAVVGMDGPLRLPPGQAQPGTKPRGPHGCACDMGADSSAPDWATFVLALAVLVGLCRWPRSGLLAAFLLMAALLAACDPGPLPGTPPRSDEAAASRALDWTIGPTRAPPPRGRARLLWRTASQPLERARPVTTCEEGAHSILPAPDGRRVYLAVTGSIFFVELSDSASGFGPETRPSPLAMSPLGVHVRRLLAFVREQEPQVILAQVEEGATARETLWLFRIQGRVAMGKRVESHDDFVDASAFYRRFDNPRCNEGLRDCIVVSAYGGDTIVSIESEHGDLPRTELEALSGAGVSDMAWIRGTSLRAQWVLHRCSE